MSLMQIKLIEWHACCSIVVICDPGPCHAAYQAMEKSCTDDQVAGQIVGSGGVIREIENQDRFI